jgi:hypothetical protein
MARGRSHANAATTAGRFSAGLGWTSDNIYNTQSFGLEEVLAKSYSIVPFAGDGRLKD